MAYAQHIHRSFGIQFTNNELSIRLGKREISLTSQLGNRAQYGRGMLDCFTTDNRGHIEFMLFRKWMLVLRKGAW